MVSSTLFFLMVLLLLIFSNLSPVVQTHKNVEKSFDSLASFAEAGGSIEDSITRLKHGWALPSNVTVSDIGSAKELRSTGNVRNAVRRVSVVLMRGEGTSFRYGAHIGEGGLVMKQNSTLQGNAYSNGNIEGESGSRVTGDAFAVRTISFPLPSVGGVRREGVSSVPLPEIDIDYWRTEAERGGVLSGNQSYSRDANPVGPKRINGNVTLENGAKMQILGPLYITGNLTLINNAEVSLDNSFGSSGTIVLVEGIIRLKERSKTFATGARPAGHILFVSRKNGDDAVVVENNASSTSVLYAPNGEMKLGNAHVTAMMGYKITLDQNAEINYDFGLEQTSFSSGPSGGYAVTGWKEL